MQTEFQIECGVPAPKVHRGAKAKYPLRDMKVGDSFVIEFDPLKASTSIYGSMSDVSKSTGFKFVSRLEAPGKRRIWRVA